MRQLENSQSSGRRNWRLYYAGLIIVAALVLSSWYLSSYYLQLIYRPSSNNSGVTEVPLNVLFNYGNGTYGDETRTWYNATVRTDWNFYNVTVWLTNNRVEAAYYPPPLNEHFVQSINGVKSSGSFYWQLWIYCTGRNAWLYSNWGADALSQVSANSIQVNTQTGSFTLRSNAFAWSYRDQIVPPVPGATKTDTCA